ncbi:MAG: hypothetical protein LBK76_02335 [Verrucomicrobiales bacterium]|jgi:hypothetical protein|nr:hypothetical protein [Verrucomicrobiales bacterium]
MNPKITIWSAALAVTLAAPPLPVTAQEDAAAVAKPQLVRMYNDRSDDYPISARSADSLVNAAMLTLAEQAYQTFLQTMGLTAIPGFALKLSWERAPLPPPYDSFASFPRKVDLQPDGSRVFTILARGALADGRDAGRQAILREEFYRSCMACYLQALVWSQHMTVKDGGLVEPPFWLREGLTQLMMKSRHATYAKIARHYRQLRRLPTLAQVQAWNGFTDDVLESHWRQALVYWLVRAGTVETAAKQALVLWLSSGDYAQDRSFLDPAPRNESWWQTSADPAPGKTGDWEQTVALLEQYKQISVALRPAAPGKTAAAKVFAIRDLPAPGQLAAVEPVRARIGALSDLQLQAHPAWMKIIEFYRLCLEVWLTGRQAEFLACVAATEQQEREVWQYMSLVGDYMDWVTVNTPVDFSRGPVTSVTGLARKLLRDESDWQPFAADSQPRP